MLNFRSSRIFGSAEQGSAQLGQVVPKLQVVQVSSHVSSFWGLGWRASGYLKHTLLTESQKSSSGEIKHESIFKVSFYISSPNIILIKESYMAKAKINEGKCSSHW